MINFNSDITKILQLDSLNTLSENSIKESSKNTSKITENDSDEATKTTISEQAVSPLNELMSEEDILSIKINKAQTIYDSLTDIRLKLRDLIQIIKDPEMRFDEESLKQMDSMSNSLIDHAIGTVRKNDDMNIVNPNFLNIYLGGLQSIRELNFMDNDFLTKLQSIEENIKTQENEYLKTSESLYSKYVDINKKYEELINNKPISGNIELDKQIIKAAEQTLASTATNITPDTVKRLFQG